MIYLVVGIGLVVTVFGLDLLTKSHQFQLLGRYVSRVETETKVVALTFDDGPFRETTGNLLKTLDQLDVKATFFVVGQQIEKNFFLTTKIVKAGHQIGNHSYSHHRMMCKMPSVFRTEIEKTDALIRAAGYHGEITFRAPYGRKFLILPYVLNECGKINVLWDINSEDYKMQVAGDFVSRVLENIKPGSIVLLHDRPKTVESLSGLVKELRNRGFEFVTVDELIRVYS